MTQQWQQASMWYSQKSKHLAMKIPRKSPDSGYLNLDRKMIQLYSDLNIFCLTINHQFYFIEIHF